MWSQTVVTCMLLGLVLVTAFVPWALRKKNIHPLIQLRLFTNRYMTVAVITMSLFAIAFFGASLLFTLYFQQVRGTTPLASGWLVAPQGFGAMVTMPIAGFLADKIGPGQGGPHRAGPRHSGHGDAAPSSTTARRTPTSSRRS